MVGIDGSVDSTTALRWAVGHAAALRAVVRAVHVSTPPGYGLLRRRPRGPEANQVHDAANAETILSEAPLRVDGESVVVEHRKVEGRPGPALVDLGRDADLLVIGATGKQQDTIFPESSLGSTTRYVVRHAACPVAVVRHSHMHSAPHRSKPEPADAVPVPDTGRGHRDTHAAGKDHQLRQSISARPLQKLPSMYS